MFVLTAIVMDDLTPFGDSEAGMSANNEVDGSSTEPTASTSSMEQSNVVSTESHHEQDRSTSSSAATRATEETVCAFCHQNLASSISVF